MSNDLITGSEADGKLPTIPTWASRAISDQWIDGSWDTVPALRKLSADELSALPNAIAIAERRAAPADPEVRKRRLTALGMTMAPNRAPAEATMWLHEVSRLLSDLPADILCDAIDALQMRMKFLPTVAEIREIAEPLADARLKHLGRLEAMRRYLETHKEIPRPVPAPRDVMDCRGEEMTEAECEELNLILANIGACTRYRPDGSRYEVSKRSPQTVKHDRPQMPTRADYLSWGVDPETLDKIAAEKAEKSRA